LIIRSKDCVNESFIKLFPKTKLFVTATSGFDHMDIKLAKKQNLTFCNSPKANVSSATELSLFHILSFLKQGSHTLSKKWGWKESAHLGQEVSEKTVALIGLGRIGQSVAKALTALNANIIACDPYLSKETFEKHNVEQVSLKEALEKGDIVSLHCPLTKKTKHMLNKENLKFLQPHALLVNCARGALICQTSLIEALEENKIQGACLDVFEEEPLKEESPFRSLKNAQLSPHIGGYTAEAHNKSALEAAQQVRNWFEQVDPVLSLIPPATKWANDL
jgi:D-3-phosphoglycerate dehydrogenase